MSYLRKPDIMCAFSRKQQSAYGTALTETDITESLPYQGDHVDFTVEKFDDRYQAGKGHEFPTRQHNSTCSTSVSQTFDASSDSLLHTFAFGCGSAQPSQPGGAVTVWEHACKISYLSQLPVFTLVEQISPTQQQTYPDMMIKSFSLTGKTGMQMELQRELIGSGRWTASSITMPGLTPCSFLRLADVTLNYKGTYLSAKVKDFSFKHTNELAENDGYHPGSGRLQDKEDYPQVRGRMLLIRTSVELGFKILVKGIDFEADMLSNAVKSLTFTAEGSVIEDTHKHKMVIEFPNTVLKASKLRTDEKYFDDDDDLDVYDVEFNVLWDTGINAPYRATITTNQTGFLDFPA